MQQVLRISTVARRAGLTSKTLRYWERIGLLPKAARTHTGYRIFAPEVTHYIDFILKAKSVGLTRSEMKRAIQLSHDGENPCPEVVQWIEEKDRHWNGIFTCCVSCNKGYVGSVANAQWRP
jgi:DNA-binding transcriptional MerR regulator